MTEVEFKSRTKDIALRIIKADIDEIVAMTVSSIRTLRRQKLGNPESKI